MRLRKILWKIAAISLCITMFACTNVSAADQSAVSGVMTVDLIIFVGQSNMGGAGGSSAAAPGVPNGQGYEFRAISDPTGLHNIQEPFGAAEKSWLGSRSSAECGTMVSSFINAYYAGTGVPVVAVSAERGAASTDFFLQPEVNADLVSRFETAANYLTTNHITIRHKYAVYFQGESDALNGTSGIIHKQNLAAIFNPLFARGLQQVFVVNPGRTMSGIVSYNEIK